MNILFLSCDSLESYVVDDHLLVKELESLGHKVETLSWSRKTLWSKYDCAIIRTTWDYMERPVEFFSRLEEISKETKLFNSLHTVRWNIHKSYLKTFPDQGIQIVPTIFFKDSEKLELSSSWSENKFVIKPSISAGSYKTLVFTRNEIESYQYKKDLFPGDWMCQPFLDEIKDGEISLVYFNKKFSHALKKVPKAGDFRVQEEFGGNVSAFLPDDTLLKLGQKVMQAVKDDCLYARVDVVPYNGHYALMELELIEPSLYFRTHPEAAKNFVKALYEKIQE